MAELLISLVSNTRTRNGRDRSRKPGLVVAVREDGHTWGREEDVDAWVRAGNRASTFPNKGVLAILHAPGPASNYTDLLVRKTRAAEQGDPELDVSDESDRVVEEAIRDRKIDTTLYPDLELTGKATALTNPARADY